MQDLQANATLRQKVAYLAVINNVSVPLVFSIIECESRFRTDDNNINPATATKPKSTDYNLFQINDYWHGKDAKKMGLDIRDTDDNLTYGFWLLKTQGTNSWKASQKCWEKRFGELSSFSHKDGLQNSS